MDMVGVASSWMCDPEQKQKLVFQHVFGIQPRHLKMNNFKSEKKKNDKKNLCCVQETEDNKKIKALKTLCNGMVLLQLKIKSFCQRLKM